MKGNRGAGLGIKLGAIILHLYSLKCKFCCVISSRSLVSCNMFKCVISVIYGGHRCAPRICGSNATPDVLGATIDALSSCLLLQKKRDMCFQPSVVYL